jgi:hypothetical protein
MYVRAHGLACLSLKFRLAYMEVLRFEDGNGFFRSMLADLEGLTEPGSG